MRQVSGQEAGASIPGGSSAGKQIVIRNLLKEENIDSQVTSDIRISEVLIFLIHSSRRGKRMPVGAELVRFGVFELDLKAGELRRNGRKLKLQEQPFRC